MLNSSSRNRFSTTGLQIALLFVLAGCFVAVGIFTRESLSRVFMQALAATSFSGNMTTAAAGTFTERFKSTGELIAENEKLREDLQRSEVLMLDRNQLYEENLNLKERLGRMSQPNVVLASVLVRPPETPYDALIIDIGEDADVSVGDRVSAGGSLLIGKVQEVYAKTARVLLYSSPGDEHQGLLRGTIPITVEGQGGGSLRAKVPYDAQVVEGDEVSLPSLEANVAFIVEYVQTGRGDSATFAYLRLPVSPFELKFVEVWRSN